MKMHPEIHLGGAMKYRGCLCEYCANVELKIEAINNICHQHRMPSIYQSIYKLNQSTLCPRRQDSRYNQRKCVYREFDHCGVNNIIHQLQPLLDVQQGMVTWKKWIKDDQTTESGGKKRKEDNFETTDRKPGETYRGIAG